MKSTAIVSVGSFLILFSSGTALCAPTYNTTTGHWYDIVSSGSNGSWNNAENNAVAFGGHLVTINDAAEEAWLRSTFSDTTRYWIGFTDAAEEGTWQWSSGEVITHTNWGFGEPSNHTSTDGGEDYAVLNWQTSTGTWNDWSYARPDYDTIQGIAEYTGASTVPVPGHLLLACSGVAILRSLSRSRSLGKKA
jgi:hypothetical protein